jgi:hypothetical protein
MNLILIFAWLTFWLTISPADFQGLFCTKTEDKEEGTLRSHQGFCNNLSYNDFIRAGLHGMGYSQRLYKKMISNCKFIRG